MSVTAAVNMTRALKELATREFLAPSRKTHFGPVGGSGVRSLCGRGVSVRYGLSVIDPLRFALDPRDVDCATCRARMRALAGG